MQGRDVLQLPLLSPPPSRVRWLSLDSEFGPQLRSGIEIVASGAQDQTHIAHVEFQACAAAAAVHMFLPLDVDSSESIPIP